MIKEHLFISELNNGLRCVHTPTDSHVGHLALFVHAGSRDETESEHGLAHYIEHVLFKGTKKRKAYHVLSRMEDVGGEINAYTNKEETCIHVSFLQEHLERALELVADIMFNSSFPEKELAREKVVIEDEIASYLDSPGELIFDHFEELMFADHTLGRTVLGTPLSLKGLDRKAVKSFVSKYYQPKNMVLSTTVGVAPEKVAKLVEKYFQQQGEVFSPSTRKQFHPNGTFNIQQKKEVHQCHVLMGSLAYDVNDKRKLGLAVLSNILGGPGMNARLSMTLRERNGYSYHVESNYTAYSDTGIFTIYIGCDDRYRKKCIQLTLLELKKLRDKPLGAIQLQKAKQQIMGQMALSAESGLSQVLGNGKTLMALGNVRTYEQIETELKAITATQLMEIAQDIFAEKRLSYLIYNDN